MSLRCLSVLKLYKRVFIHKKSKHLSLHFTQHVYNLWRYRHCDNTVGLSLAPGRVSAARSRSGRRRRTQRGEEEGQGSCYRKHGQYSLPVLILPKHHYFKNCFLMVMYGNLSMFQFLCEVKQRAIELLQLQEQSTGKHCGVSL